MRLSVPPHRTYSHTLQLPLSSGLNFQFSTPTFLDGVQVSLVRNSWTFQVYLADSSPTPLDLGLEVSPDFLRIVGIPRFAEIFRNCQFALLSNTLVPKTAYIQPDLAGWRHLTRFEPYFQGIHKKSVVGSGNSAQRKNLQFWTSLQYTCAQSIYFFAPPSLEYQVQWCKSEICNQDPAPISIRLFAKARSIEDLSSLDPKP